jgi:hypothetical protein
MANEFELLPSPDEEPGAVSSGYQRQNTNMFVLQTGLDTACLYPDANGNTILKAGTVIEYNGALFKSVADIDLTASIKSVISSSTYCFLAFDGENITATSDRGILIPSKYARYLSGKRLLNIAYKYSDVWESHGSGVTKTLYGVTYGNGLFVAVGESGTILTSPDGITWTDRSSGVTVYLNGVTYGNGLFVAVGQSGAILTSPNGITWTNRSSGVTNNLYGVTYGSGLFLAAGGSGMIVTLYSSNFGKYDPSTNRYTFINSIYQPTD